MADEEITYPIPKVNPATFNTFVNQYFTGQGGNLTSKEAAMDFLYELSVEPEVRALFSLLIKPILDAYNDNRELGSFQYVMEVSDGNKSCNDGQIPSDTMLIYLEEDNPGIFPEPIFVVIWPQEDRAGQLNMTIDLTDFCLDVIGQTLEQFTIPAPSNLPYMIFLPPYEQIKIMPGA